MNQPVPSSVLDDFFAAIETGDLARVEQLYAPDVQVWHSITNAHQGRAESVALLGWLRGSATIHYDVLERLVVDGRVAQRHVATFEVPGQGALDLQAAIFFTVEDGLITRIDEYVDESGTQRLLELVPPPPENLTT